jgi:predicted transcriptional regulator
MNILQKLSEISTSKTIQPSFQLAHVLLGLIIFDQETEGIGRYRLETELNLSEGKVRSLLKYLKNMELVQVEKKIHELSKKGNKTLQEIYKIFSPPREPKFDYKKIVIGNFVRYCVVYNAVDKLTTGMDQRDEAIKIGGSGATCLIMKNGKFQFPPISLGPGTVVTAELNDSLLEVPFSESDVLVLGTGKNQYLANIATIAAALSLTNAN